jgi:hypothetical protein
MEQYNLINKQNACTPNYKIKNEDLEFILYISPQQELCIIGQLDNNYKCWFSITSLEERETNASIFNYLFNYEYHLVSNEYQVLKQRYYEIMNWRQIRIVKQHYNDELRYRFPASNAFFGDPGYDNGRALANDICSFFEQEQQKCYFRLVGTNYINILNQYKKILFSNKDDLYYLEMKPLISILEKEAFLRLCPKQEVRELYISCLEQCSSLYNRYMSAVR